MEYVRQNKLDIGQNNRISLQRVTKQCPPPHEKKQKRKTKVVREPTAAMPATK